MAGLCEVCEESVVSLVPAGGETVVDFIVMSFTVDWVVSLPALTSAVVVVVVEVVVDGVDGAVVVVVVVGELTVVVVMVGRVIVVVVVVVEGGRGAGVVRWKGVVVGRSTTHTATQQNTVTLQHCNCTYYTATLQHCNCTY